MAVVLAINSTTIDRVATRTFLQGCRPYVKDGHPTLTFSRAIGKLTSGLDAWDGKPVTLTQDGTLIFAGDTGSHLTHFDSQLGWVREWTCYGLSRRAEYIPVTDSNTLTDTSRFNTAPDDPDNIPSRDGRTVGQIVAEVLEMPQNRAALVAAGLGSYTSAGTGASATCTISGGQVQSTFTIVSSGSGYTTAPTVILSGGGGSGATATASVSGGAVVSLSLTAAGSGYTTAPVVVLSTLPSATLSDLDGLTVIPPFEVAIAGERVLQALESVVQSCHPNHFLQVDPLGKIRFHDPRAWSADITATMDTSTTCRWSKPAITTDWSSCYTRCVIRGHNLTVPVTLSVKKWTSSTLADGGLEEDFAHDGLTNTEAKDLWVPADFQDPAQPQGTATATASISTGAVSALNVTYGGWGYTGAPDVVISGGHGSGATATSTLTADKVTSLTITAGGSGFTEAPNVTIAPHGIGQSSLGTCTCSSTTSVVVTPADDKVSWTSNYWDQTDSGHHGLLVVRSDVITGYTQTYASRVVANTALSAGGTSTLTLDLPLPATSYTSYQLYGTSGGSSVVWRRYKVTDPDTAARLANYFPYPVAYRNAAGTSATLVSTPVGTVFYSPTGNPPYRQSGVGVTVDPTSGTILTSRPTALVFSADGVTVVPPTDVQVFLPVHTGALETVYPVDISGSPQYTGTAYSALGIERTKTITVPSWRDLSNATNMALMAQEYLDSVKDVVYEGSVTYHGLLSAALTIGHQLNIDAYSYSTGWESINLPVVAVDLEYLERGGATHYQTTLSFTNRRAPFSGARFQRPAMTGQPFGFGGGVTALGGGFVVGAGALAPALAFQQSLTATSALPSLSDFGLQQVSTGDIQRMLQDTDRAMRWG